MILRRKKIAEEVGVASLIVAGLGFAGLLAIFFVAEKELDPASSYLMVLFFCVTWIVTSLIEAYQIIGKNTNKITKKYWCNTAVFFVILILFLLVAFGPIVSELLTKTKTWFCVALAQLVVLITTNLKTN